MTSEIKCKAWKREPIGTHIKGILCACAHSSNLQIYVWFWDNGLIRFASLPAQSQLSLLYLWWNAQSVLASHASITIGAETTTVLFSHPYFACVSRAVAIPILMMINLHRMWMFSLSVISLKMLYSCRRVRISDRQRSWLHALQPWQFVRKTLRPQIILSIFRICCTSNMGFNFSHRDSHFARWWQQLNLSNPPGCLQIPEFLRVLRFLYLSLRKIPLCRIHEVTGVVIQN